MICRRDFVAVLGRIGTCAFLPPRLSLGTVGLTRLSAPRLDAHTHVFGTAFANRLRSLAETPEIKDSITTVEGRHIVEEMNRTGVERAFLISTADVLGGDDPLWPRVSLSRERRDVRAENDYTAAQAAAASGRLMPFASVNPKRPYAVDELTRCIDEVGMRGVAVHFESSDIRLRDPRHRETLRVLFACAAERNVPVMVRMHNPKTEDAFASEFELLLSRVVAPLPRLRILIAHLGSRGADRRADELCAVLLDALQRHPDVSRRVWIDCSAVFVDLGFSPRTDATAERLARLATSLRAWPADRLLWGSANMPDALDQARRIWPLGEAAWETMAMSDASALLGSRPELDRGNTDCTRAKTRPSARRRESRWSAYAMRILATLALLASPAMAAAQPLLVNVERDAVDIAPGDGICSAGTIDGVVDACSLRAAIMEANGRGGVERHQIVLPAGTFSLTIVDGGYDAGLHEDYAQVGVLEKHHVNDLDIGVNVEIVGAGEGVTIIRGNSSDRVFDVVSIRRFNSFVRIANLTIDGGRAIEFGAAISFGAVWDAVLDDVTIENAYGVPLWEIGNINITSTGGGVYSGAEILTVRRCTFRNNRAAVGGGLAIVGRARVIDSTFEGNQAITGGPPPWVEGGDQGMGGGIAVLNSERIRGSLDLIGSTLTRNTASKGGGLAAWGSVGVVNSTFSGNSASVGGGIYVRTPVTSQLSLFEFITVTNNTAHSGAGIFREFTSDKMILISRSIVAGNSPDNCVVRGTPQRGGTSNGYNLEGTTGCGFTQSTDLSDIDPRLGPLRDNGGNTHTHALPIDSPAIDRAGLGGNSRVDQRGQPRPVFAANDIGAYEFALPFAVMTPYRIPDFIVALFGFSIRLEIKGTRGAIIRGVVPASDDIQLFVSTDPLTNTITVSATGLNIDVATLRRQTGQKHPPLFYVVMDEGRDGTELIEVAQPIFDGTMKDVTRLPGAARPERFRR